jgi:hypothetical protein
LNLSAHGTFEFLQNNQMRRFHSTSFTSGGVPFGRLPGIIDSLPLQGEFVMLFCPEVP